MKSDTPKMPKLKLLKLKNLIPTPENHSTMRKHVYKALVDDIRENGFDGIIAVRPSEEHEGKYEIIDGHHRFAACKELGYKYMPCAIKKGLTKAEARKLSIRRNTERTEFIDAILAKQIAELAEQGVDLKELSEQVAIPMSELESLLEDAQVPEELLPGKKSKSKAQKEADANRIIRIDFVVSPKEKENIDSAVGAAMKRGLGDNPGEALAGLCRSFLDGYVVKRTPVLEGKANGKEAAAV